MRKRLEKVVIFLNTVRYLRPVQVVGRVRHRFYHPSPALSPAPPVRNLKGKWHPPALVSPRMLGPTTFRLLSATRTFDLPAAWNDRRLTALLAYNLHYFDDLIAEGAAERGDWHRALFQSWIAGNPPCQSKGWEPYPLSRRIVNWIKWCLGGGQPTPEMLQSLAVQTRALVGRLEYHLLGNHLLANAKALLLAGLYFRGPEADRWRARGLSLMTEQLREQVLSDGGHFELSPMYHGIILEDVLDLINVGRAYGDGLIPPDRLDEWTALAESMRRWLQVMCHPDGQIALFNDAAFDIAPAPQQLDAYARRLGLPALAPLGDGVYSLPASGFVRLQQGAAVAILDVGEIGPIYAPGHGHADVLSFELSVGGQRLIVNSGTSLYYDDLPERHRQRSTAAHNTVEIEGQNSSEVWSYFRVARRAHPIDLSIDAGSPDGLFVACAHDGYRRLGGNLTHRRVWQLNRQMLTVRDQVSGRPRTAVARFHLHPDVQVVDGPIDQQLDLRLDGQEVRFQARQMQLEPATYHPNFGRSVANTCIVAPLTADTATFAVRWGPQNPEAG